MRFLKFTNCEFSPEHGTLVIWGKDAQFVYQGKHGTIYVSTLVNGEWECSKVAEELKEEFMKTL